jgi:two-component system LytT family response regulator
MPSTPSTSPLSQKIRALIVDDEPLARSKVRALLQKDPEVVIVDECGDGESAIAAIRKHSPDLVFLDIQMPECDGFEVLQAVGPGHIGSVVFITAHNQHALRAFEFHALDYLLKPFTASRFMETLARAKAQLHTESPEDMKNQILSLLGDIQSPAAYITRMVVKSGSRVVFIKVGEIEWIEAAGNYVTLHVGSANHLIRQTMNDVESRLDPAQFLRIHRSTIVNIESIREMQPLFHGDFAVILKNNTRLTLSRNYRDRIPRDLSSTL